MNARFGLSSIGAKIGLAVGVVLIGLLAVIGAGVFGLHKVEGNITELVNVSTVAVGQWEAGRSRPRAESKARIAALRSVGSDELCLFCWLTAQSRAPDRNLLRTPPEPMGIPCPTSLPAGSALLPKEQP